MYDRPQPGARVAILGQAPGEDEERGYRVVGYQRSGRKTEKIYEPCDSQPFIGATGYYWEHQLLPLTGLTREKVSIHNVLKCRWQKGATKKGVPIRTNELPPPDILHQAIGHCTTAYLRIPDSIQLIVACGELAWQVTDGPGDSLSEALGGVHQWPRLPCQMS